MGLRQSPLTWTSRPSGVGQATCTHSPQQCPDTHEYLKPWGTKVGVKFCTPSLASQPCCPLSTSQGPGDPLNGPTLCGAVSLQRPLLAEAAPAPLSPSPAVLA